MKMYVYSMESNEHVATITGSSNAIIEKAFDDNFDQDNYGGTYSPAFGSNDGLIENPDAKEINAGE